MTPKATPKILSYDGTNAPPQRQKTVHDFLLSSDIHQETPPQTAQQPQVIVQTPESPRSPWFQTAVVVLLTWIALCQGFFVVQHLRAVTAVNKAVKTLEGIK